MKHSENMDKIAPAIVAASAEIGNTFPSARGHNYSYVPIETLIDKIKPVCHKHGLAVLQGPGMGEIGIVVETMVLHTSGQFVHIESTISAPEAKGMNRAQADGAAITYLRRYQLSAIFCTAADEDVDAAPEMRPTQERPAPKKEVMSNEEKVRLNDLMFSKAIEKMGQKDREEWAAIYNARTSPEWKADVNYQIKIDGLLASMAPEKRARFDAENAACQTVEERKALYEKIKGFDYADHEAESGRAM